jgi:tetratricopeptide (TPR) repeat protein
VTFLLSLLLAFQITPELRERVDAGLRAKSAGDLDTAVREFRRVTELAPNLAAAHMNLGAVLFEKKDYGAAIPPLRKALQLNADLPGAHAMLGVALLAQGYAAEAIPHLEKSGQGDLLGVALLEAGRAREAVDRLEAALEKRPDDQDLLYYLSEAHGRLARQTFDRLRAGSPDSPRTHQMLGEAAAAAGDRTAAVRYFRAALFARPDLRGLHYALGELYLDAGDYEKAETEFRAEATLAPGSAVAAYKLGLVLLNRGRVQEAIQELQRANTLAPRMPETLLELGKAYSAANELSEAEKSFRALLEAEQDSPLAEAAHFQLGQVYRKLGRPADAERETKRFQDLRNRRKPAR